MAQGGIAPALFFFCVNSLTSAS